MTGPGFTNMGREHAEFMAEQEREEERAYRRVGLRHPALTSRPRFPQTYCSQCGRENGPADAGTSSCAQHAMEQQS